MSNASNYADSLSAQIAKRTEQGIPFGIESDSTGWTDAPDDVADYLENPETEFRECSPIDYLSDVLDIQYLVNSDRTYRSARILIAFGGPNVRIDTRTGQLEVTWWSTPEYRGLPSAFIDGLDDALSELWEMGA